LACNMHFSRSRPYNPLYPIANTFGGWMRGNPPPVLCMLLYELSLFNKTKGYELIGVLPERRNNPQRVTKESILNWGRKYFGIQLNLGDMYRIGVKIDVETIRPGTKKIYLYSLIREGKR
jgi:hypothetical protein